LERCTTGKNKKQSKYEKNAEEARLCVGGKKGKHKGRLRSTTKTQKGQKA